MTSPLSGENALHAVPVSELPASVCVYCGTGSAVNQLYKDAAADLGRTLAASHVRLVYGGGSVGLMGIVSESCMQAGGKVMGIIPGHLSEKEGQKHDITDLVVVDSMHTRKHLMVEKSDGFIVLPGGLGTLDETFEILTWKYLGLHDKPVVLVNINGFYDPLVATIQHMVKEGFTPIHHLDMFAVVTRVEDVLPALAYLPAGSPEVHTERM